MKCEKNKIKQSFKNIVQNKILKCRQAEEYNNKQMELARYFLLARCFMR